MRTSAVEQEHIQFSYERPSAEQEQMLLPCEHLPTEQEHTTCKYPNAEREKTTLLCIASACRTKITCHGRICCRRRTYIVIETSS